MDDDLDALAAEYVLGTLSAEERSKAEALLQVDSGFADLVHQWERRLGELNVMVEAVEPPPELWDKIKSGVDKTTAAETAGRAPSPPPTPQGRPVAEAESPSLTPSDDAGESEQHKADTTDGEVSPLLAALASSLAESGSSESGGTPGAAAVEPESADAVSRPELPLGVRKAESGVEVSAVQRSRRRWRIAALLMSCLAVVLAGFIAVAQIAPDMIPASSLRMPVLFAPPPAVAPETQTRRLVAVLQQDPNAPGFVLTLDPARRTMTVRRVVAAADGAHSYQLWLVGRSSRPRSLGVVGADEFTQINLPKDIDLAALSSATLQISFEAKTGSQTGPTGPILFRGRLIEAVPAVPSAK